MEIDELGKLKIKDLLAYLSKTGRSIEDLTIKELLEIAEEHGFVEKPYPEPKKVPPKYEGEKIYLNLYNVTFTADRYEGTVTNTYSCYSIGAPISDPEILMQHHTYFYPNHDVIDVEYFGSYERPNIGRAKLVYNAATGTWEEVGE